LAAARQAVIRFAGTGPAAQLTAYLPYSEHASEAIKSASALSRDRGEEQVEPEHVLLALLGQAERGSGAG
jgi:ATP-dependent Clp protease ATP-binding subunit ClpA